MIHSPGLMSDMNPLHNTYIVGLGKYRVCNFQLAYIHHLPLSCMMPVAYYSCMHSFVDHWMETKWLQLCMFQVGFHAWADRTRRKWRKKSFTWSTDSSITYYRAWSHTNLLFLSPDLFFFLLSRMKQWYNTWKIKILFTPYKNMSFMINLW
jgi:hypothetical protein